MRFLRKLTGGILGMFITNVVSEGNGTITINGEQYSGNSVSIKNNDIYIDGVKVDRKDRIGKSDGITIKGNVASIITDKSVKVDGVIIGNVKAGGSVSCDDIGGDVVADGSVNCDDIQGNVRAGGSINCERIIGRVL